MVLARVASLPGLSLVGVVALEAGVMPAFTPDVLTVIDVHETAFVPVVVMVVIPTGMSRHVGATELGCDPEIASRSVFVTATPVVTLAAVAQTCEWAARKSGRTPHGAVASSTVATLRGRIGSVSCSEL